MDCDLYIDSDKFNYPIIVLFDKNNESNPKYQYSNDATKDITNKINEKKESLAKNERLSEIVNITSKELYKAYDSNEVNADDLYSGKTGIITGKIRKIDVHSGTPCICLSDGKKGSILGVNCYFDDNNQSNIIAKLRKGKIITIKGSIRGKTFVDVCLDKCEIQ